MYPSVRAKFRGKPTLRFPQNVYVGGTGVGSLGPGSVASE